MRGDCHAEPNCNILKRIKDCQNTKVWPLLAVNFGYEWSNMALAGGYVFLILLLVSTAEFRVWILQASVLTQKIYWSHIIEFYVIVGCSNFVSCAGFVSKFLRVRTSRRGDYTKCWVLEKPAIKYTGRYILIKMIVVFIYWNYRM